MGKVRVGIGFLCLILTHPCFAWSTLDEAISEGTTEARKILFDLSVTQRYGYEIQKLVNKGLKIKSYGYGMKTQVLLDITVQMREAIKTLLSDQQGTDEDLIYLHTRGKGLLTYIQKKGCPLSLQNIPQNKGPYDIKRWYKNWINTLCAVHLPMEQSKYQQLEDRLP